MWAFFLKQSRRGNRLFLPVGMISGGCFALFALWSVLPLSEILESKAFDYIQQIRYKLHGPVFLEEKLAFIAIDDQSVDPTYSPFSDPWGRGRWQTRENYSMQLNFLAVKIKPSVLVYDILFPPVVPPTVDERAEEMARDQAMRAQSGDILLKLNELESIGNMGIQNELFIMQDLRERGEEATFPVFAFTFSEDWDGRQWSRMTEKQKKESFERLASEFFPQGLIRGGTGSYKVINLPAEEILDAGPGLGSINVPPDLGGVVRRVPLLYPVLDPTTNEVRYAPSLAFRSLLAYWGLAPGDFKERGSGFPALSALAGKELVIETESWTRRIAIDEDFKLLINARCRFRDTGAKPYADVTRYGFDLVKGVRPELSREEREEIGSEARRIYDYLHGKIALVGQAVTGGGDIGNFPLEENTPNAMAHFYVLDNILRDDCLRGYTFGLSLLILLIFLAVAVVSYSAFGTFRANLVLGSSLIIYPVFALLAVDQLGQVLPVLSPILLLASLLAFNNFYVYLSEEKEKRQVRKMFSTMVSPRVLQLMDENPEEFALRGKKTDATMFFSDLAGFTSISEKVSAEELSSLLNRYLTPMTDIILESDGYLDKYSGDGIMAVWGVPYPDKKHALHACRSALRQQEKIRILAEEIQRELGIGIAVRMGINSGQVSAGNMGSEKRFQYTVMGDAVNLAARLEPVNKDYGTSIIIGQETRKRIEGSPLLVRCLDKMVVKGKSEPVLIYELVGECQEDGTVPEWIRIYEEGLKRLWERDWDQGETLFRRCRELRQDLAATLMLERIAFYRNNPPEAGWNGAFVRKSKD